MRNIMLVVGMVSFLLIVGCGCTEDAKICPDGSAVGRVGLLCRFALCPESNQSTCPADRLLCPDGTYVGRILPDCEFAPCMCGECPQFVPPSPTFCTDGRIVEGVKNECGCQGPPRCEQVACTADAKLCPDGSAVGRVAPDCEFAPCPDSIACTKDAKLCPDGSGVGRIPPDCEFAACPVTSCAYDDPTKDYKARSADDCARIRFVCENNTQYFSDECGCGCAAIPKGTYCTEDSRKGDMCTLEYNPVCGWFGKNIQCIKYPCAINAGNPCEACHNENVEYYTEGPCPE